MVLDDYARAEEKEVAKMWKNVLEKRNILFKAEEVASEKGLYISMIN